MELIEHACLLLRHRHHGNAHAKLSDWLVGVLLRYDHIALDLRATIDLNAWHIPCIADIWQYTLVGGKYHTTTLKLLCG